MMTTATHNAHDNTPEAVLVMAFELSENTWKLGFSLGHGHQPRARPMAARDLKRLLDEVAHAKARFGLGATAPVLSGDEAGRAGFWWPRFLQAQGSANSVVDASSIAGNRRKRRAKSAGLDVRQVLRMLRRDQHGARQGWQVGTVPAVEAEAPRPLHRDLETLKQERASTTPRLQGLRSRQGLRGTSLTQVPEPLEALRLWDGSPLPPGLRRRVLRVSAH
jgi:transposase